MRKLALLLVSAFALSLAGSAAGSGWTALHRGSHGPRVSKAQWLLQGHNRLYPHRLKTYAGRIDGHYGARTATATRRAKYLLGYPIQSLNGTFGWRLHALLTGKRKLSALSRARRKRRLYALRHPAHGVVAQAPGCASYYAPHPYVLVFARLVAKTYGHPLVCTSGYRPGSIVFGTNRRSMHGYHAAADLGTPTYAMNTAVGHAALRAAGMTRSQASRYSSFAGWYGGVNILFHTYIGGNHYNHVHTGLWSWPTGRRGFSSVQQASQTALNTEEPGAWNVVYHRGLRADPGTGLAYAIAGVKHELAFNGYQGQMNLDSPLFGIYAEREARLFQAAHALTADGIVGPLTARALFRARALAVETARAIPDHLLARQKTWESQNDPNAIGPDGGDRGLMQIRLSSHPDVTLAEAIDPAFSLPWAGQHEAANHSTLHDWDATLCAWNAGYSLAVLWLAAGEPPSGGPVNGNGVDLFTACFDYVRHVRSSPY